MSVFWLCSMAWLVCCRIGPRSGLDVVEKRTSFVFTRIQTRDHQAIGIAAILTMLIGPPKFLPRTGHESLALDILPPPRKKPHVEGLVGPKSQIRFNSLVPTPGFTFTAVSRLPFQDSPQIPHLALRALLRNHVSLVAISQ